MIDQEVSRLLSEAEDRARALLSDNRGALDAVIAALLEKETISGDDLGYIVSRTRQATSESGVVVGAPSTNSTPTGSA